MTVKKGQIWTNKKDGRQIKIWRKGRSDRFWVILRLDLIGTPKASRHLDERDIQRDFNLID